MSRVDLPQLRSPDIEESSNCLAQERPPRRRDELASKRQKRRVCSAPIHATGAVLSGLSKSKLSASLTLPPNRRRVLGGTIIRGEAFQGKEYRMIMMKRGRRWGITLIELVVVVGIISILCALLLLGVMSIRESSRRLACSNNLRQLGLAVANYETSNRRLPYGSGPFNHSLFISLLPHLEQSALYDRYQFDTLSLSSMENNDLIASISLAILNCPSAPSSKPRTDYLVNRGTSLLGSATGPFEFLAGENPYMALRRSTVSMQSSTSVATISESKIHGPNLQTDQVCFELPLRDITDDITETKFVAECVSANSNSIPLSSVNFQGFSWHQGTSTSYLHVMRPNTWDCVNERKLSFAIHGAGSSHAGGLNLLFLDGHTSYLNDSIERDTWVRFGNR
jgi:prepilin-type processing-associated H-X9-DG protein